MNKVAGFLFSARLMAVLLALFAVSIGLATFIENDFGSLSARALVYNAHWFELLLLLGAINLIGRVIVKRLYTRQKISIFLFHIAFIIILAGAAITRYTGSEGTMSIREGASSDNILTGQAYIQVRGDKEYNFPVSFSPFRKNRLKKTVVHQAEPVTIKKVAFIPNAYETIESANNGTPLAEFIFADSSGRKSIIIQPGETKTVAKLRLNFNRDADSLDIKLINSGDSLYFVSQFPVSVSSMGGDSYSLLEPGETHAFRPQYLYSFNGQVLLLNQFYPKGKIVAKEVSVSEASTYDAIVLEISSDNFNREIILTGKGGYPGNERAININGKDIILSYGSINRQLPFKLVLNDFIVERYPGSRSPSSFESRVMLIDTLRNITSPHRIYMNNILKYRGYRFYQSSYDADEKGTILSVNHDQAGTGVTYSGYALLTFCMIISLFSRKSRFQALSLDSRRIKQLKNSLSVTAILLAFPFLLLRGQASNPEEIIPVDATHAARFGRLLIQDNSGRVEPVNTLSSEVVRKLSRKSTYKGMNSDQVLLGMLTDPAKWQYEPIIRSSNTQILDLLGTQEKYHSFGTFFRNQNYILQDHVARAFRQKPALRTRFDNEVIKLDERINICYLIFTGELLRVFPVPGDSSHTWYSYQEIRNKVLTEDSIFTRNVFLLYFSEVQNAIHTGNWKGAEDLLNAVTAYQTKYSGSIMPSDRKISMEIFLNQSDVFARISKFYGIIGFMLLIIQFIALFYPRLKLKVPVFLSLLLIIVIFCFHSAGLGLRWYVSGHAPWSNGYEALTYVAWAAVLAGLIFSFKSSITLSVSGILGFLTLFVAHLSWMDPQITNLVPVLKSYWLVIHVATITASYGFLAMGALLAYVNLLLMFLYKPDNRLYIKYTILELSNTLEMALTIGLYLLTIGVFLGAVWANESWGRYWGWDPKETWALVTVLVYAFVLHMRMVPGLKGTYSFNLAALLGFSSVIMTYFGVNYYLSGLHSYAKGDPLPVPVFVYYTVAIIVLTAIIARFRSASLELDGNNDAKEAPL